MHHIESEIKIFAGSSCKSFVSRMCRYLNVEVGKSEAIKFSDGNTYVKIHEKVRDKDVYIVQSLGGPETNDHFMELLFWIDAFRRSSANTITAIIPYFSYAKGDKKDEPRVSIRARVCADSLEAVGIDRIITMDLHTPQIQGFFKKPVDHLIASPILCKYLKSKELTHSVIVSPDSGFAKNATKYAAELNLPMVICDKVRSDHSESAKIVEVIGDVWGRDAIVVDDFTLSFGSLAECSRVLKLKGAKSVMACVTHAPLTQKGVDSLEESEITELVVTDTIENALTLGHPKIRTISVAEYFAESVRIINNRDSLSELFEKYGQYDF